MYFVVDKSHGFIQIGGGSLQSFADFVREDVYTAGSLESFSTLKNRVLKVHIAFGSRHLSEFSLRINYRPEPRVSLGHSSSKLFAPETCRYVLWDIASGKTIGTLPLSLDPEISIQADAGCVRIDNEFGQTLRSIDETFHLNNCSYMVTLHREMKVICHRKTSLILGCFFLLTSLSGLTLYFYASLDRESANKVIQSNVMVESNDPAETPSAVSNAQVSPILKEFTNSTSSPTSQALPKPRSFSSLRVLKGTEQRTVHTKPSVQSMSDVPSIRHGQSVPRGTSQSGKEGHRPDSCKPIVRHHESPLLRRLLQDNEPQGEWYVCR